MTESWSSAVAGAISAAPTGLDLRDAGHLDLARATTEKLLSVCPSLAELDRLEASLLERRNEVPLLVHLAVKLARSRRKVEEIDRIRSESAEPDTRARARQRRVRDVPGARAYPTRRNTPPR